MDTEIQLKKDIINYCLSKLQEDLQSASDALSSTKELASGAEMKAESKWDTRGIEAGFLAGAQQKRVTQIEIELAALKELGDNLRRQDSVGIGSVVVCEDKKYFITSKTGGMKFKEYTIVSISSPVALKLLDDEIEILEIW
mgnify:CR=1 FL=1